MSNDGIRRSRWPRRLMQGALVLVVAGGAGYYFLRSSAEGGPVEYRFGTVERGTITNVVSSTGKVVAVGEVKISSQVAGQIIEVLADYNTPVTAGQVLARLDPEAAESKVAQVEADLAIARASLLSNRAAVERSQSDLRNGEASMQSLQAQLANSRIALEAAERDYNLQRELYARNVVATKAVDDATTKYEQAKTNFEQITANIAASQATQEGRRASLAQSVASVTTAEAQVKQRVAQLASAKIDLERTVIKSPTNGTVIDRTAEVGTTVTNNSNVALFTVAQDLRNMQLDVSVDEADIGKIQQGMNIKFNVDAFPGREFQATVRQLRLAPKTVQNVVTYTIIAQAPNPDLSLLPGMTATARVIIEERANAMRIPNSALRYTPVGFQAPATTTTAGGTAGAAVAAAAAAGRLSPEQAARA
ncbi:MAG: HlyD family secretion protein, partial [Alphaproteobacteria bacterium]|nr:HlyD family secretion protein [Alphaproteobacteria bacterium]